MRNSVGRGVIFGWLKHAVIIPTGIILTPLVLGRIGKDMYGIWVFLNCFVNYYGLMCLGLGVTISRYTSKYYTAGNFKKLNETASLIFFLYALMGAAAFLVCGGLAYFAPGWTNWDPVPDIQISAAILIIGVNIFVSILGGVFGGILLGIQRYDLERSTHIAGTIFRFLITIVCLQRDWGLPLLALFNLLLTIVEVGGHAILAFRHLPELSIRWRHVKRETFRECYSYTGFALLDDLAEKLIYMTDNIVIGLSVGFGAIVPFQIASRVANDAKIPIRQIGQVFLSKAGELDERERHDQLRNLVQQGTGLAFMIMAGLFCGVWFFGDTLAATWMQSAGEWLSTDTVSAHTLMILLVGAQVVAVPVAIIRSTLSGMGRNKIPALIYMLEAIANLVLSLILVRSYGVVGVAIGTLIPILFFELVLLLPYACRELKIAISDLLTECLVIRGLPVIALGGFCFFGKNVIADQSGWLLLMSVTFTGAAVFGLSWLAVARLTGRSLLPSAHSGETQEECLKTDADPESGSALRVLIISNLYPNRQEPGRAVFNKQQFAALGEFCDYRVVAPLPLFRFSKNDVPAVDSIDGVRILHPRYLVIPKILRSLHGIAMYLGMYRQVRRELMREPADVILATWAYPDCFAAALLAKSFGLPLVNKVHGTDCNYGLKFYLRRKMIRYAMCHADKVVSVSSRLRDKLVRVGVPKESTTVLLNGVDSSRFYSMDPAAAREQLRLDSTKRHVLFVGNLVKVKSVETLIHALKDLPDNVQLHVMGDGPLRVSLRRLAEEEGVSSRVQFHGRLPHDELPVWFNAADVFCLPSLNEGCPNVVIESIACGTPVVASDVGAIPDLISSPRRGEVVEPGDIQGFATAINKVLLRGVVPEEAGEELSWKENAATLFEILSRAAGAHQRVNCPTSASSAAAASLSESGENEFVDYQRC